MLTFELVMGSLTLRLPRHHVSVSTDGGVLSIRIGSTQEEVLEALSEVDRLLPLLPETKTQLLAVAREAVDDAEEQRLAIEAQRLAYEEEQRLIRASMERGVVTTTVRK